MWILLHGLAACYWMYVWWTYVFNDVLPESLAWLFFGSTLYALGACISAIADRMR